MRVNLLFGFLGSGKTTLARHLLSERGDDMRTAVIVNEFGDVGIDGDILKGNNVDMVEINSGCLCCTLKGSLMLAVEELREKAGAERIIVEATGVAAPAELLDSLADSSMKTDIDYGPLVTVVDAPTFNRIRPMLGEFYEDQIEYADIVILNKVDMATAEELESVRAEIEDINDEATVLFAEQCDVDTALLLNGDLSAVIGEATAGKTVHTGEHDHELDHDHNHAHDIAESFVLAAGGNPNRASVEAFFARLPDNVWRAKGFMHIDGEPCLLQYTMGQLEITPSEKRNNENLVFIGRDMDRHAIDHQFAFAQEKK
ncbi:MAG: CobW family GTP-binding protein [Gammaproteobacteria bacterium]